MQTEKLNSREKFLEDYAIMSRAAVGVIVVRTREPYRFMDVLHDYAAQKKRQFKLWKNTRGWEVFDVNDPEADPKPDNEIAVVGALEKIGADGTKADKSAYAGGYIYAMVWPHFFYSEQANNPAIAQILAEYSRSFSDYNKRLVLCVPPAYKVPAELEDMICVIDTDLPAQDELQEVYEDIMAYIDGNSKDGESKKPDYDDEDVSRILAAAAGMTITEFETALARATVTFGQDLPNAEIDEFVSLLSKTKAEIIKRSEVLELMPLGKMEDVGGLELLKDWIGETAAAYEPDARDYGVDLPRGVALIGPPGTGKSLSAKAIAHSLGRPLVKFDVSNVFAGVVGASEARVREALKLCDAIAPCVVLIDEVDKVFDQNASSGDSGVGKRILGKILTHMQESRSGIFWVMSANRVANLPAELLRKGRLDEVFSVTLPAEKERQQIIEIHLRKRKQDPAKMKDMQRVVEACAEFVGSEIEAAISRAVLTAYRADAKTVTADMIIAEFEATKPLSHAHAEQFQTMRSWCEQHARPSSKETPPETPANGRERRRPAPIPGSSLGKKKAKLDLDG